MAGVSLTDVTKRFGGFTAVNRLSLDFPDGGFSVLVGPSGCGKSTILRMIAGLETVSEGEIRIGDRLVNRVPPKDRDIAMVFQNYALYPHMNVFDNMAFGLTLRKMDKTAIGSRVRQAAALLGIEDKLRCKPGALSGGQRQRVAVGRAIVRSPKVFLFDEPLSNLDAKLRVQTRTELKKLHRKLQTTTLFVTHDQVEALTLGDKIAVMRDGTLQQYATPEETYAHPANMFVAGFIGSPAMNFLPAQAIREKERWRLKSETFDWILPSEISANLPREVVVGIRPEDLTVSGAGGQSTLPLQTSVIEHIGSALIVHGQCGRIEVVASLDPKAAVTADTTIRLSVNLAALHIFDPKTEMALL